MPHKDIVVRAAYRHDYYEKHKDRVKETSRFHGLKRYNMTPQEYAEKLFLQGGTCAIRFRKGGVSPLRPIYSSKPIALSRLI